MATISLVIAGDAPASVSLTGVARLDTGAPLAGFPAAMVLTSGAWVKSFTEPADGLEYSYTYTITWSDATTFPGSGTVRGSTSVTGSYAGQSDLEDLRGRENVAQWSDLANGATADAARILRAIQWAEAEIERQLSHLYAVPLSVTGGDAATVTRWAAVLACGWLYRNRGQYDDPSNAAGAGQGRQYAKDEAAVMDDIRRYRAGLQYRLNAARVTPTAPGTPVVIRETVTRDACNPLVI